MGLENGKKCWGATTVSTPVPTSMVGMKACTVPCKGNEEYMCGGERIYDAYAPTAGVFGDAVKTANAR